MRKFAVLLVGGSVAIEIVSEQRLKNADGQTFANESEYLNYVYGEGNIIAFSEVGGENKPVEILIYKEGVTMMPTKDEQSQDYNVTYW